MVKRKSFYEIRTKGKVHVMNFLDKGNVNITDFRE